MFVCLQADLRSELGDRGYLAFGAILFVWELLPTSLLILIFRVRRPAQEVVSIIAQKLGLNVHYIKKLRNQTWHSQYCWNSASNFHLVFFFVWFSQSSSMAVSNRVLPRPYFFDDPQGSDDDTPVPWARSHPHSRYLKLVNKKTCKHSPVPTSPMW